MDKVMLEIDAKVKAAIEQATKDIDQCEEYLKKATGDLAQKLDAKMQNLRYRKQRLGIVSDILSGRAYTVVEKNGELFVHKDKDARLISLAEKCGLTKEFVEEQKKMSL